ncbi:protein SCAR2-like isoform X2 [Durio zibethinus]|uniref:Protein SCAR n=1 Tax=Durio zibethinus TaxID=66656 RepID=A0A6P6ASM2_DURZI|nr:protein SCAR2-like isoform X2 [Durio zibethinus]
MPLTRYQIRNEYSLADPELHRAADKDDPEALLEGVAMAGLVGLLRQLGDLAEFAAEIFHDLHEEVMATAARGHGLMVRVQQLEAEFPSIEKAFLSQTNHSLFFTNAGVDWHPNMRTEHNLITRGDLPRCVLDSYEECRGPPRLFLLDKFDVAGAGACLKRYTDPSFFKTESAFPGIEPVDFQREKKARKVKKKGSRWRNLETPEFAPTSHAKLQQLFLEERIENAYNDPARLVKLKRRQLNESPLHSKSGKGYMEKFLETPSLDHKAVYEASGTPPPLRLTLDHSSESGLEILEIGTVSPVKNSSQGKETSSSSPTVQEVVLKPAMEELNGQVIDREIVRVPEPTSNFTDGIPPPFHKVTIEKEIIVDGEGRRECSTDGDHSDDMTSEVDNYMDALTTMESEMDTDNEYRSKNDIGFLNGSDATDEKLEVQAHSSDSHSVVISVSDDGNSSFKKGTSSFSYSDTLDNLAEDMPSDGEVAAKVFPSNKTCVTEIVEAPSIQLPACSEMQCSSSDKVLSPKDTCFGECRLPDLGEASYSSCLEDLNSTHILLDQANSMVFSLLEQQLDEVPSDGVKTNSDVSDCDGGKYLADSAEVNFADVSEKYEVSLLTLSTESHPVDELDCGGTNVSSDGLPNLSNILQLAPEKRSEEQLPCSTLAEVERGSGITLPAKGLDVKRPVNLSSEVNDTALEAGLDSECMTPMLDTSEICGFNEQQFSDILHDDPELEVDPTEVGASYSEQKQNVDELFDAAEGEETREFTCSVNVVDGDAIPCDLQSHCADNLDLKDHVGLDDLASENVLAESIAVSTAACGSTDFDDGVDNITFQSSNLICSQSGNLMNLEESLSGAADLCVEQPESNEVISQGCHIELETREETNPVDGTPADIDSTSRKSVSHNNYNLQEDIHYSSLAEPTKSLNFFDLTASPTSSELSDQGSELKYSSHLMVSRADLVYSSSYNFSEKETSLEQSSDFPTNQHDVGNLHIVEDSSNSSYLLSNQIQSLDHIDQENCLQTSIEHSEEGSLSKPSLEFSQKLGRQDKQEIYPSDPIHPAFGLLPEATKVSMEELPPLPPLPPMQWRIGRVQHVSPASQRELVEQGQGLFPRVPEYGTEEKAQFGLPALEQGIEQPRNPFLPIVDGEERSGHLSDQLAVDCMQPSSFSMHPPTMGSNANSQYSDVCLDRTHSNPFLTLPIISNESLEYGSIAMEGDMVESSYSLPMPATDTISRHIPVSSHEKTTHPPNQFVLDIGLEGGHPKQNSEGELGNPPDIFVHPQTKREEQIPTKIAEDLPKEVEEQPQHGLAISEGETAQTSNAIVQHGLAAPERETAQTSNTTVHHDLSTSEEEAAWPSTMLALLPVVEDGNPNGNRTLKLPRPRNPLIDAVAAHDKSKLRKVTERIRPPIIPKVEERDSLLEQIRTKSFNLKPAVVTRPSVQGPKTNLRVAAILEKANAIRQALAGSDEDDDEDSWSDS